MGIIRKLNNLFKEVGKFVTVCKKTTQQQKFKFRHLTL